MIWREDLGWGWSKSPQRGKSTWQDSNRGAILTTSSQGKKEIRGLGRYKTQEEGCQQGFQINPTTSRSNTVASWQGTRDEKTTPLQGGLVGTVLSTLLFSSPLLLLLAFFVHLRLFMYTPTCMHTYKPDVCINGFRVKSRAFLSLTLPTWRRSRETICLPHTFEQAGWVAWANGILVADAARSIPPSLPYPLDPSRWRCRRFPETLRNQSALLFSSCTCCISNVFDILLLPHNHVYTTQLSSLATLHIDRQLHSPSIVRGRPSVLWLRLPDPKSRQVVLCNA
ncbi:hypothetical protein ACRALDRAFT_210555 [Sodiomyces alcalophilus JCM 7366]|uniref:uncharacterized protein n=1 Tax=Sodiomyces alcalophilus JCM 7366 TaxID=591952 RepID=UPI0039B56110